MLFPVKVDIKVHKDLMRAVEPSYHKQLLPSYKTYETASFS